MALRCRAKTWNEEHDLRITFLESPLPHIWQSKDLTIAPPWDAAGCDVKSAVCHGTGWDSGRQSSCYPGIRECLASLCPLEGGRDEMMCHMSKSGCRTRTEKRRKRLEEQERIIEHLCCPRASVVSRGHPLSGLHERHRPYRSTMQLCMLTACPIMPPVFCKGSADIVGLLCRRIHATFAYSKSHT